MSSIKQRQRNELSIIYLVLGVAAILTLVPFAYMICSAFKTKDDFFSSLFLPRGGGLLGIGWDRLTTEHFRRLFGPEHFGVYLLNSLFIASVTSVLATLCCAMGGYALAKFRFKGRNLVLLLVLGSLVLPGALLLAPSYELLYHLRMLNSYGGVILPAVAPAFGVFLFRQATISGLPDALIEAARIDGCGEVGIFFGIALPMVKPMIGAFLMITYLATWNNFIWPQIVLQSDSKFPLAVAIAQLRGVYGLNYGLLMAGSLVSVLPVLVLFLMLQREFIAGLTSGAVKG
jgi:ABC-type glycerol-3-phosphate transport system permease component